MTAKLATTILESLLLLYRRRETGKDRRRDLTKEERELFASNIPVDVNVKRQGVGNGDVHIFVDEAGKPYVGNLDWQYALRWLAFNGPPSEFAQILGLIRRLNALDWCALGFGLADLETFNQSELRAIGLKPTDIEILVFLYDLQGKGRFKMFRDYLLNKCPHLEDYLQEPNHLESDSATFKPLNATVANQASELDPGETEKCAKITEKNTLSNVASESTLVEKQCRKPIEPEQQGLNQLESRPATSEDKHATEEPQASEVDQSKLHNVEPKGDDKAIVFPIVNHELAKLAVMQADTVSKQVHNALKADREDHGKAAKKATGSDGSGQALNWSEDDLRTAYPYLPKGKLIILLKHNGLQPGL